MPEPNSIMPSRNGILGSRISNAAAEVESRTIGADPYKPTAWPGRNWDATDPCVGIPPLDSAAANVPPRPEWGYGEDPHGYPRISPDGIQQETWFLSGQGVGPCVNETYCYSNGWAGEIPP